MHIPDGYLSPQTYGPLYAIMVPVWVLASRFVKKALKAKQVPLLAIGAAFTFVIMMFNIPIPGGTTGHATGGVLVAILLGPWAAVIACSIALVVQALLFGDGGVTAIGANCFNMAFILPFVGYYVYRAISGNSPVTSSRRWIAGGIAGYIALNVAALVTAIEFGIQPLIARTETGQALYAPYPLNIAIPAMAIEHLLLFGFVEAVVTGLVIAYLQKADVSLLVRANQAEKTMSKELICPNCGYKGEPKKVTKGSIFIELILWLAFLIPGLIYSIWRLTTKHSACPQCGATNMVPLDSPRGKKLLGEFQ